MALIDSHWHQLFENLSTSTQEFYAAVEAAVARRSLPEVSVSRVTWREGGIASADREYLRVERKRMAFDICSAPYGTGHFFSWWLARIPPRYGILVTVAILAAAVMALVFVQGIASIVLRGSCAGLLFQLAIFVLGLPTILVGGGFLVQEGVIGDEELVLSLPILGWLYEVVFNPLTYYRQDTALMFRDSVRSAVEEVLNQVREGKGLRALGSADFLPHEERDSSS